MAYKYWIEVLIYWKSPMMLILCYSVKLWLVSQSDKSAAIIGYYWIVMRRKLLMRSVFHVDKILYLEFLNVRIWRTKHFGWIPSGDLLTMLYSCADEEVIHLISGYLQPKVDQHSTRRVGVYFFQSKILEAPGVATIFALICLLEAAMIL